MKPGLYYIHGIDEINDRAAEVKPAPYLNPILMTEGEMYLRLMGDQVRTLAQYYPDRPVYKKGLVMINNALHQGIHGVQPAIGAIDPGLYPVARAIDVFKLRRQPAVRVSVDGIGAASWQEESMIAGEIPDVQSNFWIWWWFQDTTWLKEKKMTSISALQNLLNDLLATKNTPPGGKAWLDRYIEFKAKYEAQEYIIKLYNDTLEKAAHHPLYNFLPQNNEYTGSVITKQILHGAGVQSMANVGDFSTANMTLWTRNGILRANIAGKAGAISPEMTAFSLSNLPDSDYSTFLGIDPAASNTKDKSNKMGIAPAVLAAILGIIGAAVGGAFELMKGAQQRKTAALANVQGWGTTALEATQADWKGYNPNTGALPTMPQTSDNTVPLLIGGAAALYLLTQK